MDKKENENFLKAGKISREVVEYARGLVEPGVKLLELAEKIESKIVSLGGRIAFPVNLSIDDVAAHYTPAHNDESVACGLLKVDLGVHINGCTADTAFSVDLEGSELNKKLIEASKVALESALAVIKKGALLTEIGKAIQQSIVSRGFVPIANLSGHEIMPYNLHSGLTIPNVENKSDYVIDDGAFAIEPFATNGAGNVYEGRPSGIYQMQNPRPVRDSFARQVLAYIMEEYETLPFCSRWLVKKFGTRVLFSLQLMEQQGILHHYPQLIEKNHGIVSQAEKTVLIFKGGKEII